MRVIGIDPGLAFTGFGVIEKTGRGWRAVECGTIKTEGSMVQARLAELHQDLRHVLAGHNPQHAVVEAFVPGTARHGAGDVLQARGVILLALEQVGLTAAAPHQQTWKAALVGGRADKREVMAYVARELGMDGLPPSNHAADALAMAIWFAAWAGVAA